MSLFVHSLPVVSVSAIFCLWNTYRQVMQRRRRQLHERVTYLLWRISQVATD
jgi:hypothetical protein